MFITALQSFVTRPAAERGRGAGDDPRYYTGGTMPLRKSAGNMYSFVTHTWNPIKGKCFHDCTYCYMKQYPLGELRLDEREIKADLGEGNFIFVGSGTDIFAENVPGHWIIDVLNACLNHYHNKYLWQTKNPKRFLEFKSGFPENSIFCITLESNRHYPKIMGNAPTPEKRVESFSRLYNPRMITIEPILDFDLHDMLEMVETILPQQINIGADSKGHHLPEPSAEKVDRLIIALRDRGYYLTLKSNLKRVTGGIT